MSKKIPSIREPYNHRGTGWTPAYGWPYKWYCDGCNREHGYKVVRFLTLDGRKLCTRQFLKEK